MADDNAATIGLALLSQISALRAEITTIVRTLDDPSARPVRAAIATLGGRLNELYDTARQLHLAKPLSECVCRTATCQHIAKAHINGACIICKQGPCWM